MRKESGDPYTPRSIVQLISGLNCKISLHGSGVNITDNKCPSFQPLHTVLDNHFSSLHSQGIGTVRKQAGLLTFEKENRLWELEVLSAETPMSLLNAMFVHNGINLVLRGGQEHHGLKLSQFTSGEMEDPDDPASKLAFFFDMMSMGQRTELVAQNSST